MVELKSIKITAATKKKLDSLKIHPRETYEELLKRITEETKWNQKQ